jgi:hypothetical protein
VRGLTKACPHSRCWVCWGRGWMTLEPAPPRQPRPRRAALDALAPAAPGMVVGVTAAAALSLQPRLGTQGIRARAVTGRCRSPQPPQRGAGRMKAKCMYCNPLVVRNGVQPEEAMGAGGAVGVRTGRGDGKKRERGGGSATAVSSSVFVDHRRALTGPRAARMRQLLKPCCNHAAGRKGGGGCMKQTPAPHPLP